jgi:hypothetical protein
VEVLLPNPEPPTKQLDPEEIGQDYMARVPWGENWREGFDYLHKLIPVSVIF